MKRARDGQALRGREAEPQPLVRLGEAETFAQVFVA